ncbi:hypothetical protein ACHWQZ_G017899 [Mnemiopsis leidyi]
MVFVGLDLFLSVECGCQGESQSHDAQCDIQSKLPLACTVSPNRWLIQYGRFLVRDELFDPNNRPIVPYKSFREFGVTLKSPVKKNSKESATYFVDIELPKVAKHFMDWLVNELEKSYGQIKYQNRLHLVLTDRQFKRLRESGRTFTQFKGTVRSIVLVQERKEVNVKIVGIKESRMIWSKQLRPTAADTTVDVQAPKKPVIHHLKKQCLVGWFLIMLFGVIVPAVLYFSKKFQIF